MPISAPRDSTIAVVGDGFGSLIVYATAVYLGFRPEEITIYGPSDEPGQDVPAVRVQPRPDGPALGVRVALPAGRLADVRRARGLVAPKPRAADPLDPAAATTRASRTSSAEANVVARTAGLERQPLPDAKVGWLQRADSNGDTPHFVLFDEDAQFIGRAKHVMLALRPRPAVVSARAREGAAGSRARRPDRPGLRAEGVRPERPLHRDRLGDRVGQRVGERARRRREVHLARSATRRPDEQDLNTPRCFFEALGIDAFQALDFDQRIEFLGRILKGTSPHRRGWDAKIAQGREEGRFEQMHRRDRRGQARARWACACTSSSKHGEDPGWLDVTGVVAGTGFNKSALTVPLLRRLVEYYKVPIEDGRIKLQSNCGVPGLDRPDSRCAAMGIHANAVIPHGDTIAGLKYIGRRFVADCFEAEKPEAAPLPVAARDAARARGRDRRRRSGTSAERSSSPNVPDRPRPRSDARRDPDRPGDPRRRSSRWSRRTRAGSSRSGSTC